MTYRYLVRLIPAIYILTSAYASFPALATDCTSKQYDEALAPATTHSSSVTLNCSLLLQPNDRITKKLVIAGDAASGITIDCAGAVIDSRGTVNESKDVIEIKSVKDSSEGTLSWSRPENITVKNCKIYGAVRVYGMAKNGEDANLRESSYSEGHTERTQANAPKNIVFKNVHIIGLGKRIPLYFGPGVTHSKLLNSEISGKSNSVVIYFDAESGWNTLKGNSIHAKTKRSKKLSFLGYKKKLRSGREVMALDGSANNKIINNRFSSLNEGGIYLYRNCGEGGTIRHQSPSSNQIINNSFYYNKYKGSNPAIWVASRNGNKKYCEDDAGYPFGSSINNNDIVRDTVIAENQIYKRSPSKMIKIDDVAQFVHDNQTITKRISRKSGCFVPSDSGIFLKHGERSVITGSSCQEVVCNDGELTETATTCSRPIR